LLRLLLTQNPKINFWMRSQSRSKWNYSFPYSSIRSLQASHADIDPSKKLKDDGKLLDIQVLDHIIMASESYYSFADEGLL
jgi:DNA repair protein RadC